MKLHDDEVDTDAALVEALLAEQFPELAGTGARRSARRARSTRSTGSATTSTRGSRAWRTTWRTCTASASGSRASPRRCPCACRSRSRSAAPAPATRSTWAIFRWLEGAPYAGEASESTAGGGEAARGHAAGGGAARGLAAGGGVARGHAGGSEAAAGERGAVDDERDAAVALARFVAELRTVPVTAAAPRGGRRPLRELDRITRDALATIGDAAALAAWERALEAPPFGGAPVWIHGDLLRPNLLAAGGRLSAVIDFGSAGVGDPAADVVAAWAVFRAPGRTRFREALGVDDGTWERARGYALHQAALIVPYYADTNPGFVAHARRTIAQVLAD